MKYFVFTLLLLSSLETMSQTPVAEWWFWPEYDLGRRAAQHPGPRIAAPRSGSGVLRTESVPFLFHGEEPSERITDFLPASRLPSNHFSIEMWMLNHVNQPVGALAADKSKFGRGEPAWLLGMHGKEIVYSLKTVDSPFSNLITHSIKARGWKNYWFHLVATYDGKEMALYVNGDKVGGTPAGARAVVDSMSHELELAAYLDKEPYMELGNLVKMVRLYDRALSETQIHSNFDRLKELVVEGKLYPQLFHFNAGPYLNNATQRSVSIVWETDRPADFVVQYGKELPLMQTKELSSREFSTETGNDQEKTIYKITLDGLEPETPYFYNIQAQSRDGSIIESGVLTFATAIQDSAAFSFAVIGDTEARPHINDRICKLVWDERPNLIVNVGDLTDGGKEDQKFQWNYEYFAGVTQLASRIPVFPVPGNGEDDLHWYKLYHALPEEDGFYSFRYGNAEYFMLNSNEPEELAPGGRQYVWLEEKLKSSTAVWKFVAHHHAPYSDDEDDYGNSWKGPTALGDLNVRKIVPLYEKYGVDIVFFGHLHTYQRTHPIAENRVNKQRGVIYIQGGGGGGNLEDFSPTRAWFSAKTYRGHHYFIVTVFENELNMKMYDTEGRLKDYLDIRK